LGEFNVDPLIGDIKELYEHINTDILDTMAHFDVLSLIWVFKHGKVADQVN